MDAGQTKVTITGREMARALETLQRGDIFLWANPYPDEDPMMQYLLLEDPGAHDGRLDISPLGTNMTWPPINSVDRKDLVILLAHAPTPEETEQPKPKRPKRK